MGSKAKKDKKKEIEDKREERKKEREMLKKMRKRNGGKGDAFKLMKEYIKYYEDFDKEISVMKIKLKDVGGDGNCLFRALADQFDGNENTHIYLREEACKYILNNEEFFRNFLDEDEDGTIQQYVQGMRKNGEWGGHLELQALSECLQCILVIHKKNLEEYYVTPIINEPKGPILHLAYFQNEDFEHYLSIRDIEDNTEEPAYHKLKHINNNMYRHLANIEDPEELALMKQIEEISLNENNYEDYDNYEEGYYEEEKEEIKEPYPGLPPNKKCKCGSGDTYKNCCLKKYHKNLAKNGY